MLIVAITVIWIPCAVGNQRKRAYKYTISSLFFLTALVQVVVMVLLHVLILRHFREGLSQENRLLTIS